VNPSVTPVFVMGAKHSGTTILYRMLAFHPDATWFSQFSLRGGELEHRRSLPLASSLDRPLRRLLPHQWTKDQSWLRRVAAPRPGEAATVWTSLLGGGPDQLREVLTDFAASHGKQHLLTKWPAFHRHIELLHRAFPQATFVHIVRDGRAVALSLRANSTFDAVDVAADYWAGSVGDAKRAAERVDLLEVRYEDLCTDVHGTLIRVLDQVGLDTDRFTFDRCPATLRCTNDRWFRAGTPHDLETVTSRLAHLLTDYGYPLTIEGGSHSG
jgi:hypothetical protein